MRLRAVKCHHSLLLRVSARELPDCLAFYFLPTSSPSSFCHSISSTFDLFYFHFKGSDGTDVVSNVCLLPHCLKVRDDYFLMKAGPSARSCTHSQLPAKLQKHTSDALNENVHPFPRSSQAVFNFLYSSSSSTRKKECASGLRILISSFHAGYNTVSPPSPHTRDS